MIDDAQLTAEDRQDMVEGHKIIHALTAVINPAVDRLQASGLPAGRGMGIVYGAVIATLAAIVRQADDPAEGALVLARMLCEACGAEMPGGDDASAILSAARADGKTEVVLEGMVGDVELTREMAPTMNKIGNDAIMRMAAIELQVAKAAREQTGLNDANAIYSTLLGLHIHRMGQLLGNLPLVERSGAMEAASVEIMQLANRYGGSLGRAQVIAMERQQAGAPTPGKV